MKTRNVFIGKSFLDRGYTELNPLNYGYHECPPSHVGYGMRNYYMIHYVISGHGSIKKDNKTYTAKAGQMFIICPHENAAYTADENDPWTYRWIGFSGKLAEKLRMLDSPIADGGHAGFSLLTSLESRADTEEEIGAAVLYLIFADIFSGRSTRPHYVRRTVDAINSLYMSNITVERLADEVGLDRRYLSRIFKKAMGVSIQEYIIDVRMREARRLLSEGKNVSITAELVGYSDVFNFSKMFKKRFGISPKSFSKNSPKEE